MIGWILASAGGLLLLFALLAPLESLRWWSTRGVAEMRRTYALLERHPAPGPSGEQPARYVLYLSGVGMVDGCTLSARERSFCDDLAAALPGVPVIAEVFPYAVDNRGLLQRATAWLWGRLARLRKARRESLTPKLIHLRNTLQVMVSADPRYGPTLSAGLAQEIWRALLRHGYTPGCGVPVTLIGFSGGAQMAIGSASMLTLLGVEVSVISIGGVFGDDPGLDHVTHLWDIRGSRDRLRKVGPIAFPGRWPFARGSTWHHAVEDGRVTVLDGGPVVHDGRGSYFEGREPGPDGVLPADRLLALVTGILG
ncbi:MAG: hypothetical protein QM708_08150 [Propioniciclava sp.]|uniref:hypothetical protein n=1 Tax=Propioniciclava sp. TaxID=2038686 RepID=UPI0039E3FD13